MSRYSLYGCRANYENCAGFCDLHKCYMTVKQIKRKECLGKQCRHLHKLDHYWWTWRENKKLLKKGLGIDEIRSKNSNEEGWNNALQVRDEQLQDSNIK